MFETAYFNPVVYSYLGRDWLRIIGTEFSKSYMDQILLNVKQNRDTICPHPSYIFRPFREVPFHRVRVVLVGNSPYPNRKSDGLAYSNSQMTPPLRRISKELNRQYKTSLSSPDLSEWSSQGVLLLNRILTTKEGATKPPDWGWETFTGKVISLLSSQKINLVFLLWGKEAHKSRKYILKKRGHLILQADPYQNDFIGNGHFEKCNRYLIGKDKKSIQWQNELEKTSSTRNKEPA